MIDRESMRDRLAGLLRLLSACAWLVCALALFREPLGHLIGPFVPPSLTLPTPVWSSIRKPSPAPGFVLSARSIPPGGRLWVDDQARGALPAVVNVACRNEQSVEIVVTHEGYRPWSRTISCREGASLVVRARFE